jgi:paired amphipathic helix protein Sin3a
MEADHVHQQEQQGVSQLQSAASVAASQQGRLSAMQHGVSAGGLGSAGLNGGPSVPTVGQQLNMEKRGPVEFNHAISYVNKIKVR